MTESIHPVQAMVDAMNAVSGRERAKTQMTLGSLIKSLESLDQDKEIVGFGRPISYRGYYSDLAFEPSEKPEKVSELVARARSCMGKVFVGYKGGDYVMGETTPVWVARYGEGWSPRLMGLITDGPQVTPILAKEDDT